MNNFGRGTLLMTFANLLFFGSGYLIQILVGRYFTPGEYGLFGIVISTLNLIMMISVSGVNRSLTKYIAENQVESFRILKFSLVVEFISCGLVTIVLFIGSPFLAEVIFKDPELTFYFRVISLILPFYIFRSILQSFFMGLQRYIPVAVMLVLAAIVKMLAVGIIVLLGYKITGILVGYWLAAFVSIGAGIFFALSRLNNISGVSETKKFPFNRKQFLYSSFALTVLSFVMPFFQNLSLYLIKFLDLDIAQIGFYNAALTLGSFPSILIKGVVGTILPISAELASRSEWEMIGKKIGESMRYIFLMLGPLVIFTMLGSSQILSFLFTDIYLPGAVSLSLLTMAFLFFSAANIMSSVLIALGKEKELIIVTLVSIIINVGLGTFLVRRYGISGAAWSTLIAFAFSFFYMLYYASRVVKLKNRFNWVIRVTLANIAILSIGLVLLNLLNLENKFLLAGVFLALEGFYLAILYLLGEIRQNDITYMKALFKIKNK